jgi:hypothetical protein
MGFYDCRCLATGVSLKGADAALVLLQRDGDAYRPLAAALHGPYNRLGAIDNVRKDAHSRLVLNFFLDKLQSGAFVVAADSLRIHGYYPIRDVEQLLACFERALNDNPAAAVLDGRPVVFALFSEAVWDALASSAPEAEDAEERVRRLFAGVPAAEEMYLGQGEPFADELGELEAVSSFLAGRGLAWRPANDLDQHSSDEMKEYLRQARAAFRDCPTVLKALRAYEREVRDLLEES